MTKNKKRFGIVAIMLVLILAIGATAGTTLARYISSASVDAKTATVARWGFTMTGSADELFSDAYNKGKVDTWTDKNSAKLDVWSGTKNSDIVAPGTGNSATVLTIKGSAEVAAQLTIDVSSFTAIFLKQGESTYYPIKWTVGSTTQTSDITDATGLAGLIKTELKKSNVLPTGVTVDDAASTGTKVVINIPAGTNLGTTGIVLTLGWEWELGDESSANNQKDTILGQLAELAKNDVFTTNNKFATDGLASISSDDYSLTVGVGLAVKIMQVQNPNS